MRFQELHLGSYFVRVNQAGVSLLCVKVGRGVYRYVHKLDKNMRVARTSLPLKHDDDNVKVQPVSVGGVTGIRA